MGLLVLYTKRRRKRINLGVFGLKSSGGMEDGRRQKGGLIICIKRIK